MSTGARTARVVPDLTGLDKQFDYLVPEALIDTVMVGSVVRVPLGPRTVRAWVVSLGGASDVVDLKPIAKVAGLGPSPELVGLAPWAAHRWAGRLRPFLLAASAPTLVKRATVGGHGRWSAPTDLPALPSSGGVVRLAPCSDVLPTVLAAAERGPCVVCVPGLEAAGTLAARLRGQGLSVAVDPRESAAEWARAAGGVDVVIGARAVVWAPCPDLAAVVVLDEHDEALQDERSPTWHARDVAIERARRAGVPCWLVSPTPSLEALAWAGDRMARPSRLAERAGWPIVELVDRTREDPPVVSLVTRALLDAARRSGERVVCVLNTTGRARRLVCRQCRAVTTCAACGAAVSQDRESRLVCGRCGVSRPALCQTCGSLRLVLLGVGVTRLRDELAAALRRPVVEVSAEADPEAVDRAPADAVFVGTEAVLHRVRGADTVVFMDIDDELLAPRFRAADETLALLVRAARLVGPRSGGGRILVQTRQARHEVLQAVLHADPGRLVEAERARRTLLSLPPVAALAAVTGGAAGAWLAPGGDRGLQVQGPAGGRWLVRAATWEALADGLASLAPRPRGVRVEVDPRRV